MAQLDDPGPAVVQLGDSYAAAMRSWWADHGDGAAFERVFQVLPPRWRHVTLTMVDVPATNVSAEHVEQLHVAITDRLAGIAAFEIEVGPAVPNEFAVELYIRPDPRLTELRDAVADAYRATFPRQRPQPTNKPWRAHTALGYCRRAFDHERLASALLRAPGPIAGYLAPVTARVDSLLLAATDPWDPAGEFWDERSRRIRMGG